MAAFEGKTSSRLSRDGKAAKIVESSGKFRVEVEGKQKGGLFSDKSSASSWAKASGYEVVDSRVDALVKDCDKLAARMDALNKRADACFNPKRADDCIGDRRADASRDEIKAAKEEVAKAERRMQSAPGTSEAGASRRAAWREAVEKLEKLTGKKMGLNGKLSK